MGMRGLPVLASWAGGRVGVPRWEAGGRMLERDWRREAVDCRCCGAGAGALICGAGLVGGGGRRPFLVNDAMRSTAFVAGAEAVWFWTLFSCVWLAFWSAGAAARICGVPGFWPFANSAWSPLRAAGSRNDAES